MSQVQLWTLTSFWLVLLILTFSWCWTGVVHAEDFEQLLAFAPLKNKQLKKPVTIFDERAVYLEVLQKGDTGEEANRTPGQEDVDQIHVRVPGKLLEICREPILFSKIVASCQN